MRRGGISERFPTSALNYRGECHQQSWGIEMGGPDPCRATENSGQKKRTIVTRAAMAAGRAREKRGPPSGVPEAQEETALGGVDGVVASC